MKSYRIVHDAGGQITTVTWSNVLAAESLGRAIGALDSQHTCPAVLWDFSSVQDVQITRAQVQLLAGVLREQSSRRRSRGKTAVLAPSDLLFGLARQAHAFAMLIAPLPPIEIFRDLTSAETWLKAPPADDEPSA